MKPSRDLRPDHRRASTDPIAVSNRPRAREIGLRLGEFEPGPFNAITDIEGVRVGHTTLVEGHGPLKIGVGPIRTGVTAILPNPGNLIDEPVEAAHFVFNGAGTSSGLSLIDDFGRIETPILLTDTFSVGAVYDALTQYLVETAFKEGENPRWFSPAVGSGRPDPDGSPQAVHLRTITQRLP